MSRADRSTTRGGTGRPMRFTMFKRILCPMDFSDSSLKALEYALALAKEADAELLLMHVIEGLADVQHWQQPLNPSILEYLRFSEQNALTRLRAVIPADAPLMVPPPGDARHRQTT